MTRLKTLSFTLLLAIAPAGLASAQDHPPPIDAAQRSAVIATLAEQLHANYVFPDVAERVAAGLKAKDARGEYAADTDVQAFSDALSKDLAALGDDGHFRVVHAPGAQPRPQTLGYVPSQAELDAMRDEITFMGFGLQRVERLEGNVGYIELRGFGPTPMVAAALSAAMTLVSGTDGLILDLRRNGGGEPSTVAHLMSHFFPEGDMRHLNDIYTRPTDTTQQFWTNPSVEVRYDKPVYVLTSKDTFSAGEECAYDFQTQERGTIVGETTGGGANPGDDFAIGHDFVAFIPTGRSINPVTLRNWEHVGVQPDIATTAADAQRTAHLAILSSLLEGAAQPRYRAYLQEALQQVQAAPSAAPPSG